MVINNFRDKYWFLSNFYPCKISYSDCTFNNSEAAFQAMKCPERKHEFENLEPNKAKSLGRKIQLRSDWETVKDKIMEEIVYAKFTQNANLGKLLIDTKDAELVEGTTNWNDKYWGKVENSDGTWTGKNQLGITLMNVRSLLGNHEIERRWTVPYSFLKNLDWSETKIAILSENKVMVRFRQNTLGKELTIKFGEGMDRREFNCCDIPNDIISGIFDRLYTMSYLTCKCKLNDVEFDAKYIKQLNLCIIEKEFNSVEEAEKFDISKYAPDTIERTTDFNYNMLNIYNSMKNNQKPNI